MSDWRHITLGDLAKTKGCTIQTGPFGSQLHKHEYKAEGIGVVNPTHMADRRVIHDSVPCVSEEVAHRLSKHRVRPGDLLFARRGEIGRHALITESESGWLCGTGCFLVRVNGPESDSTYISFYLSTDESVEWLNRHAAGVVMPNLSNNVLQRVPVALPPLPEQKKIAHILSTVQRAIEAQERIIQTTTELKKALMHKLFTEGLRHEPQKQTEIGPIPESWEMVELGELLEIAQYGMSVKGNPEGNHPILRMTNQVDGQIVGRNLQFVEISDGEFEKFRVGRGDILFNRTNSLDLVGRTAIFDIEGEFVFASYLIRLRTDGKKLNPFFLNCYFNTDEIQARLKSIATRAVSQSNISATRLKGFPVPKPSLDEQDEIVACATALDRKLAVHRAKLDQLQDLFRTLLHELMTAKTRVHELELSE
jgi:type I restriction enzyme S subunit